MTDVDLVTSILYLNSMKSQSDLLSKASEHTQNMHIYILSHDNLKPLTQGSDYTQREKYISSIHNG